MARLKTEAKKQVPMMIPTKVLRDLDKAVTEEEYRRGCNISRSAFVIECILKEIHRNAKS